MYITKIENKNIIKEFLGTTRVVNNKVLQTDPDDFVIITDILLPKNIEKINKVKKFYIAIGNNFFEHTFSNAGLVNNRFSFSYTLYFKLNEDEISKIKYSKNYDIYAVDEYENILDSVTGLQLLSNFKKIFDDARTFQISPSILNKYIDKFYIDFDYQNKNFFIDNYDEDINIIIERFKDICFNLNGEKYRFSLELNRKNIIERDFSSAQNFYYKLSEFILNNDKSISNITAYLNNENDKIRDIEISYSLKRKSTNSSQDSEFTKSYTITSDVCKEIIQIFLKYKKNELETNLRFSHVIQRSNEKNLVFDFSNVEKKDIGLLSIDGISNFEGINIADIYSNDQFNENNRIFFYEKPLNTLIENNTFIYFSERLITNIRFKIQNTEEFFIISSVEESTNFEIPNDFLNTYKEIYNLDIVLSHEKHVNRGISNYFKINSPSFENKDDLTNIARELKYFLKSDDNQEDLSPSVDNLLKNSLYYVKFDLLDETKLVDSIEKLYTYEELINNPDSLFNQIEILNYQYFIEKYPTLSIIFDNNTSNFIKHRLLEESLDMQSLKIFLELEFNILSDFKSTNDYRFKGFDQDGYNLNNVYSIPLTSNDITNEVIYNANTTLSNFIFSIRNNEIDFLTQNKIKGTYLIQNSRDFEKIDLIKKLTKTIKNRSFFESKSFIQKFLLDFNSLNMLVSEGMTSFLTQRYIQPYSSNYNIKQISKDKSVIFSDIFVTNIENEALNYNTLVDDINIDSFDINYKALSVQAINIDSNTFRNFTWKIKYAPNITIKQNELNYLSNNQENFAIEKDILWLNDKFYERNSQDLTFHYFNSHRTIENVTTINTDSNRIAEDDDIISSIGFMKIENIISEEHINYLFAANYSIASSTSKKSVSIKGLAVKAYFYDPNGYLYSESFYNIPFIDSNNNVISEVKDETLNSIYRIVT